MENGRKGGKLWPREKISIKEMKRKNPRKRSVPYHVHKVRLTDIYDLIRFGHFALIEALGMGAVTTGKKKGLNAQTIEFNKKID